MRSIGKTLTILFLFIGAAGCSDGPLPITHDCLAFWNEVCDNMARVTDEDSAKRIKEIQFDKLLEGKAKVLKERFDKRMRELDKAEKAQLDDILIDYYYEIMATQKRIENSKKRLAALAGVNPQTVKAINDKVNGWYKDMENWSSQNFSAPAKGAKALVQFSKGVAPLRQDPNAGKK